MAEIVNKTPVVEATDKVVRSRSKFNFSNSIAGTFRYGEYTPHFVMEVVNNDKIKLQNSATVRSYTFKSPLMSNLRMKKDYFQVPMESILPLNWDKIYTNPVLGDDVNANNVNCIFSLDKYVSCITALKSAIADQLSETTPDYNLCTRYFFQALLLGEYVFSDSSLFSALGMSCTGMWIQERVSGLVNSEYKDSFSGFMELVLSNFIPNASSSTKVYFGTDTTRQYVLDSVESFRVFLDIAHDNSDFTILGVTSSLWTSSSFSTYYTYLDNFFTSLKDYTINISRVLAYQLCCFHFYTNDKIDYTYSAELYRQLVGNLEREIINKSEIFSDHDYFTLNSITYPYDYLSGALINKCFNSFDLETGTNDLIIDLASLLFGYRRSLRFVDYFTGAKSQPLAVGDVDATVTDSKVNAVDMTRSIQKQRFLNFVNRTGRRFEEYTSKLMGKYVAPDWHNPKMLCQTSENYLSNFEVENTASSQIGEDALATSVTSFVKSGNKNFAFEMEFDRPSILIGISYFDVPRYYESLCEKQNYHVDRYDMFNPFMQFIGDQKISSSELLGLPIQCPTGSTTPDNPTFGYGLRHIEYKTRVPYAFGGFVNGTLPSWIFTADSLVGGQLGTSPNIKPDFIRSWSTDLDKFYVSLTGITRSYCPHFIVVNQNNVEAVRPMVYAPSIL